MTPSVGINEASFVLRVGRSGTGQLDFETRKVMNFSLVAEELADSKRQSRIPVTVHIRDASYIYDSRIAYRPVGM